jgi:hypothetical protein
MSGCWIPKKNFVPWNLLYFTSSEVQILRIGYVYTVRLGVNNANVVELQLLSSRSANFWSLYVQLRTGLVSILWNKLIWLLVCSLYAVSPSVGSHSENIIQKLQQASKCISPAFLIVTPGMRCRNHLSRSKPGILLFSEKQYFILFDCVKLKAAFVTLSQRIPNPHADNFKIADTNSCSWSLEYMTWPPLPLASCPNHIAAVLEGKNEALRRVLQHVLPKSFEGHLVHIYCVSTERNIKICTPKQ